LGTRVTAADGYDVSDGEIVLLSTWESTRPLMLLAIGFSEKAFRRFGASRFPTAEQLAYYSKLSSDALMVQEWLDRVFTVKSENSSGAPSDPYAVQYAVADAAFCVGRDQINGIIYPSTRHDNLGADCYVFDPDIMHDALQLVSVDAQHFFRLTNVRASFRRIAEAIDFAGGELHWRNLPPGPFWEAWRAEDLLVEPWCRLTELDVRSARKLVVRR